MEQSIKKKKKVRSMKGLWAEKRITAVLKKGGIPWEWVESSVTQNIDVQDVALVW